MVFVNRAMTKVLEHKHIIIRAEVSRPITRRNKAIKFLNRIIKAIGMKAMYGPTASYCKMKGNRGVTAFAIIETSHIAMHIWDEVDPALVQLGCTLGTIQATKCPRYYARTKAY